MSFLRKLLSLLDCFQDFHENIIILSKPIPSCATYRRTIKAIGLKKVKAYEKIFLETWDFPQNIYLRWTLFLWLNCNRFSRTFLTFSKKSKNEKHPEQPHHKRIRGKPIGNTVYLYLPLFAWQYYRYPVEILKQSYFSTL